MALAICLYGFRIYPMAPLVHIMQGQRWMRRFDFDPEAVVRLAWAGVPRPQYRRPRALLCGQRRRRIALKYLRDNTLLTWMHLRLLAGFVLRLPLLVWRKTAPRLGHGQRKRIHPCFDVDGEQAMNSLWQVAITEVQAKTTAPSSTYAAPPNLPKTTCPVPSIAPC